jgi:glycosyltransferase involved in cell wall biosynthesis
MNVLIASRAVAPLHGWGGLERAVADLCTGLSDRGHCVTLVTTEPVAGSNDPTGLNVARLITLPWPNPPGTRRNSALDRALTYPRVVRAAERWMARQPHTFDAVIGMGALTAAFVTAREHGKVRRLILNPQGMEEFFGPMAKRIALRPQQRLVRLAARQADHVIATDASLVTSVQRTLRVSPARIVIIPNGVDIARIDAFGDESQAGPANAFTLISVARIVPNKGLTVLAEVLGQIHDRLPPSWHWVHAGDGPARAALDAAIERAGIAPHAPILGNIPERDLHRALAGATLFVHPTRYEGSSLVTLEAMTHGLPVIASAAGGIPDKVVPGVTGWLVPPGDAAAFAGAIVAASQVSTSALRAMGHAGRARAVERFSLSHTLDLTERLLSTPVDARRA